VHVPYWATDGVRVSVNGKQLATEAKPTSYLRIEREWNDGDRVEVQMPFALYAAPMPDDPELVAIMYGPVVLAGIDAPADGYVLADPTRPETWVTKTDEGPLTFAADVQGATVKLIPWYQVLDERYGVYWRVTPEGSERHRAILAAEEARKQREARFVDRVRVGDPESERAHNLQGERMGDGPFQRGHHWRHAPEGWFSWDLKVLPDRPMTLVCEYWGSDVPPRTFDIRIDEQPLATQALDRNRPNEFFEVEYAIPPELTRGKDKVTVRFQAHPGNTAGGVFDCGILRPEE